MNMLTAKINKVRASAEDAVAQIESGATVLVGGFGDSGSPKVLLDALSRTGARDLTIVSNNAGHHDVGIARLILNRQVSRVICSFPVGAEAYAVREAVEAGSVALEICPQGVLAERMRAGGAGIGGFLVKTGLGTELAEGKPIVEHGGESWILESPLTGDYALVSAQQGDRWGNLRYRLAQQNFNPLMAMAAQHTIAEVREVVELGGIAPSEVHSPSVFVDSVVQIGASRAHGKDA